jgi:hypothetical protein
MTLPVVTTSGPQGLEDAKNEHLSIPSATDGLANSLKHQQYIHPVLITGGRMLTPERHPADLKLGNPETHFPGSMQRA